MSDVLAPAVLLLVSVAVFLGIQLLRSRGEARRLSVEWQALRAKSEEDTRQWKSRESALEGEIRTLSKYRGIIDAEAKAAEILQAARDGSRRLDQEAQAAMSEARKQAETMLQSARGSLDQANQEARTILAQAREKAKTLKEEAQTGLDNATTQAARIVADANKRAEEIAGTAYTAMKNADLYEQAAKAMKNVIEGYGDAYLIPTHSLLDDLAEEFGHTEAGEELKKARERTKLMVRNRTSAQCDYVEATRKDTAVDFVVDAFNGKVDSILSRVRNDNVGTLQQEIRDAFTLVNVNGRAFRNARITEEYLAARHEELKWAAIVQELKLQEREEQRRIKEQIREEEKARKEYERAMREAAREEDLLHKAMEKVQRQVEQASAEQKAKYEEQLLQLTAKLKEAEDKNQRALSMAQQTKKGHVYIISNVGSFGEDVYKIGLTRRLEPLDRIRELGDASVPFGYDVHALIVSDDAPALERELHRQFVLKQMNKVNYRKEFFRVSLREIHAEVEKAGLSAKWTMLAEAREYRETLAIEKAIADNPALQQAWLQQQLELDPTDNGSLENYESAEVELNGTALAQASA